MPRPPDAFVLRFSTLLLVSCGGSDKEPGTYTWKNRGCPTEAFRAACNDLDQFEDMDRTLFADACESSMPTPSCIEGEVCLDASCIPDFADDSASCTGEDTPIDQDLTRLISEVARESCAGESYGEGTQSTAYIERRGDGTLQLFYGSTHDAGTTASCFPEELAGLALAETDCVLHPRLDWEDVRHNHSVTHPDLDAPLYTGESAPLTIGNERYTITVGTAEKVVMRGPLAEGDQEHPIQVEVLVVREGYTLPGEPPS